MSSGVPEPPPSPPPNTSSPRKPTPSFTYFCRCAPSRIFANRNQRNALGMAALESVAVSQSRGSPAEVKAFLTALFRSPGSNMRARPWRWPAKSGGRGAAAALATLKKRQQQRQQALAGGEAGAGNREDVVDGGGGHATVGVEEGLERRERRGGGAGMPREDNFLGQSAKSTREGVDGMVGRWRVERHGSDRRRLRALLGSTTRQVTAEIRRHYFTCRPFGICGGRRASLPPPGNREGHVLSGSFRVTDCTHKPN